MIRPPRARLALALGLAASAAVAQGRTEFRFPAERVDADRVYAAWNPHDRQALLSPGIKVLFFGNARACSAGDGRTAHPANPRFEQASRSLTGLAPAPVELRWTPSGDTPGCDASVRGATADTFVELDPDKGLGLYTDAAPPGGPAFFGAFGAGGQNGQGANHGIEGSFVSFRLDWHGGAAVRPFGGGPDSSMHVRSRQGVAAFRAQGHVGDKPVQVKQQMVVTLVNEPCMAGPGPHVCQLKYLLHTALYRDGVDDWSRVGWFRTANVIFDPAQGGLPVIQGPIGRAGEVTEDREFGLAMYRSVASPTQHDTFEGADFDVEITFAQLRNAVRMISASKARRDARDVSDADVAAAFGPRWQDPSAWALISADVGQEVSNHTPDQRAFIGGNVRTLSVGGAGR